MISFIYFLIFLIAIPAHHMAVKLILLPLIILSFNLPLKNLISFVTTCVIIFFKVLEINNFKISKFLTHNYGIH